MKEGESKGGRKERERRGLKGIENMEMRLDGAYSSLNCFIRVPITDFLFPIFSIVFHQRLKEWESEKQNTEHHMAHVQVSTVRTARRDIVTRDLIYLVNYTVAH